MSTKEIALAGKFGVGKVAIVDDDDYEWLVRYRWRGTSSGYATASVDGRKVSMHRLIMRTPVDDMVVDHINGKRLDNRKDNLRVCTQQENVWNSRKHTRKSSPYKGVSWENRSHSWRTQIGVNGHSTSIGRFVVEVDAAFAYNEAATSLFGEFACLNEIPAGAITRGRKGEIVRQVREWIARSTVHDGQKRTPPKHKTLKTRKQRREQHLSWWARTLGWVKRTFGR